MQCTVSVCVSAKKKEQKPIRLRGIDGRASPDGLWLVLQSHYFSMQGTSDIMRFRKSQFWGTDTRRLRSSKSWPCDKNHRSVFILCDLHSKRRKLSEKTWTGWPRSPLRRHPLINTTAATPRFDLSCFNILPKIKNISRQPHSESTALPLHFKVKVFPLLESWAYQLLRSNPHSASIISPRARGLYWERQRQKSERESASNRILWRGPHANGGYLVWIGMCVLSDRTPTQQTAWLLPQLTGILNWWDLLFQSPACITTHADDAPWSLGARPARHRCPSQCWGTRRKKRQGKVADEAILSNELKSKIVVMDFLSNH